jgi:putative addiction module component (TIGR02574 family)
MALTQAQQPTMMERTTTERDRMSQRDAVLQQALTLEEDDRAFVADALESSLTSTGFASDEIADAWSKELNRRIAAYHSGETTALSLEESLEFLQTALAEHRVKRTKS